MDRERHALIPLPRRTAEQTAAIDITETIELYRKELQVPDDRPFLVNTVWIDGPFYVAHVSWWEWKAEADADAPPAGSDNDRPRGRRRRASGSPAVETGSLTFEDAPPAETPHESGRPCGCDPGAGWTCEQHQAEKDSK
jgi:hypothetical protein